jgi:hypothetical protein
MTLGCSLIPVTQRRRLNVAKVTTALLRPAHPGNVASALYAPPKVPLNPAHSIISRMPSTQIAKSSEQSVRPAVPLTDLAKSNLISICWYRLLGRECSTHAPASTFIARAATSPNSRGATTVGCVGHTIRQSGRVSLQEPERIVYGHLMGPFDLGGDLLIGTSETLNGGPGRVAASMLASCTPHRILGIGRGTSDEKCRRSEPRTRFLSGGE